MRNNVFIKKVNKYTLSANDDKRTQSIDSIEIHAHGTNEVIIHNI